MAKPASFILVFIWASPVAAQESLLPTHISGPHEITVTAELRYTSISGFLSDSLGELDYRETHVLADLRFGVGVGGGFEIEGSFPVDLQGRARADESDLEIEIETGGLGDLTVEGNYLLRPATGSSPQIMAGLLLVLPTGDDDLALAEIRSAGSIVQEGEKGGIGDGVFKAGFQFGLSQRSEEGQVYYGQIRYVFPLGTQNGDDFEADHADVFSLTVGGLLPLGEKSSLELKWALGVLGDEVVDFETGGDATEEAHYSIAFESRFLFNMGRTSTLILGLGFAWIQDHELIEQDDFELEDAFGWGLSIGLHFRLGVPPKDY